MGNNGNITIGDMMRRLTLLMEKDGVDMHTVMCHDSGLRADSQDCGVVKAFRIIGTAIAKPGHECEVFTIPDYLSQYEADNLKKILVLR